MTQLRASKEILRAHNSIKEMISNSIHDPETLAWEIIDFKLKKYIKSLKAAKHALKTISNSCHPIPYSDTWGRGIRPDIVADQALLKIKSILKDR